MKATKLYYNGKRLKDIYVGASKWQVFKYRVQKFLYRVQKFLRKVLAILIVICVIYVAVQFGRAYYPVIKYQSVINTAEAEQIDTLKDKVETLKWEVIDGIKAHESKGYNEDDGLIVYDPLQSNPSKTKKKDIASIGSFQMKQTTIIYYYKKLYNEDITMKEAVLIALDDQKARQLTYDIVFKANGINNWLNYANKQTTKSKLSTIKELE